MTQASGCWAPRQRPWPRQSRRPARAGRSPARRVSSTPGALQEKRQSQPRQQFAAIGRGRGQNQRGRRLQKQRLAPDSILTGVGAGPIIRGPWQRACQTESIARGWRRMQRCWSASIRSASCLACRICWRTARAPCARVSHSRNVAGRAGGDGRGRGGAAAGVPALPAGLRVAGERQQRDRILRTARTEPLRTRSARAYAMDEGACQPARTGRGRIVVGACRSSHCMRRRAAAGADGRGGRHQNVRGIDRRPFAGLQDLLKKT